MRYALKVEGKMQQERVTLDTEIERLEQAPQVQMYTSYTNSLNERPCIVTVVDTKRKRLLK